MNIDYDKACSMIKTYFGLKIHKESLMKLLPYCKKIEFQKSEIILEIGEEMKNVYFILSGLTRSYYLDLEGRDITKSFIGEYNFCIAESFLQRRKVFNALKHLNIQRL